MLGFRVLDAAFFFAFLAFLPVDDDFLGLFRFAIAHPVIIAELFGSRDPRTIHENTHSVQQYTHPRAASPSFLLLLKDSAE